MEVALLRPNHLNVREPWLQIRRHHDIAGVEVAVAQVMAVQIAQSVRHLQRHAHLHHQRERSVRLRVAHQVLQRAGTRLQHQRQRLLVVGQTPEHLGVSRAQRIHRQNGGV